MDIEVTLGARPGTEGKPFPPNEELEEQLRCGHLEQITDAHPEIRVLLHSLISGFGDESSEFQADEAAERSSVSAGTMDLFHRLDLRASPDDGFKLNRIVYLLRDGFKAEKVTRNVSREVVPESVLGAKLPGNQTIGALGCLHDEQSNRFYSQERFRDIQAPKQQEYLPPRSDSWFGFYTNSVQEQELTPEYVIGNIRSTLLYAGDIAKLAYVMFDESELDFIALQRYKLSEAFARMHYIDSEDEDKRRAAENTKLVKLGPKLQMQSLVDSLRAANSINQNISDLALREALQQAYSDNLTDAILYEEETEYGRIVITGTGESWFTGPQPALHIDLGGDDFYSYTEGGGASLDTPVGVIIDLGGNDAYESTTPFCQGSGSMGVSLLVDSEGDDSYIGLQWAQGCGFFGCGALIDNAGNDTYRGEEFCQAAAIFGTGLLLDYAGDDRYEAQMKSQGFGGSRGVGLLIDVAGNDYRYAKGKYPTGYGDAGIFDAWSQGCAMGFRGLASGGIAGVIDMAGSDYNEAGNFSQGGGYYFGYGFFHDLGWEDDVYIGSRYNQGFSAHQAVGVFLEDGGNDRYITRQAVAQGLAWDESVSMFIDYGGDDYYDGGTGFSQGASAHNSLCVTWDVAGRDTYKYKSGQARAGGNDYHGGTSLSLFLDTGGDLDWYDAETSGNNLVTGWPEHGFFADLPGTLEQALEGECWKDLWQSQEY